ncbi:MAG: tetratricopeptide repeat protein [Candidatus Margulisiibacteriota bacterium]
MKQNKSYKELQKEQKKKAAILQNIPFRKWVLLFFIYIFLAICAWQSYLPLEAEWFYRKGFNYDAMGNHPMAAYELKKAVKAAPWETHYEVNLGKAYENMANQQSDLNKKIEYLKLAEKHYEHTIIISPLNPWYHNRIGEVYRIYAEVLPDLNERQEYLGKYEHELIVAANADKNNPLFNMSLAYFYHRLGQFEKAKELYTRVIDIDYAFSEGYFNLADIYRREGNIEKTKEMYEKLIKNMYHKLGGGGHFNNACLNLGRIYFEEGNVASASVMFELEAEAQPKNEAVLRNLAAAYQRQERWYDLIRVYHKVLLITPKAADIKRYLGYAYFKVGKLESAVDELEGSLAIEPGDIEAKKNLQVIRALLNRNR